jgi:Fanconi anemia group M protein
MGKPLLRVDSAESASGIPALLCALGSVEVEVADLQVGDYEVGDVGIERKSALDFLASIRDRRLFSQAKLLAATFAKPVLVLEGRLEDVDHGFEEEALTGALSYLPVIEGVSVIPTRDTAHSARLIARMALHRLNGLGYEVSMHGPKPAALPILQRYVVGSLPGIGAGRAIKLLQHFGSVEAIFAAGEPELAQVAGLGPKLAARMVETIRTKYRG